MNEYLIIYEDCKIVKGYKNHLFYDLNRADNSNYIPDSLHQFIELCHDTPLNEVLQSLDAADKKISKEYIQFIIEREFGFIGNKHIKDSLTELNTTFETPEYIENIILEIENFDLVFLTNLIDLLENLMCSCIEIRIHEIKEKELSILLKLFSNSIFESIYLHINYRDYEVGYIESLSSLYKRIKSITIYDFKSSLNNLSSKVSYKNETLMNLIKKSHENRVFTVNQDFYIESVLNNTYFNKKLFIDPKGKIKNAPESELSFGKIQDLNNFNDLILIIENNDFQKYWRVSKNHCDVCKSCEYRNSCLDSRLPRERKTGGWYHEIECDYNPYIGKWKDEDGYRTLDECGVISNEKGFNIDKEKLDNCFSEK